MTTRAKISRPDRALIAALALTLATAGGCFGAVSAHQTQTAAGDALSAEDLSNAYSGANLSGFAQLATEHRCLTEALYYEARGEGRNGQEAVAEVVFHRLNAGGRYGHSICAVVYKGSSRPGCQFSFTCNGDLKRPREAQAWEKAEQLAAKILTHEVKLADVTSGATNYHAVWVSPDWAPTLKKTARIGNHIFYRTT